MEFKLRTEDYVGIALGFIMAILFLGLSIVSALLVIHDFTFKSLFLAVFAILFSLYAFYVLFNSLSCNCKSFVVNFDEKIFTLNSKENTTIQIPFSDIKSVSSKHSFGRGKSIVCINILTKQNVLYTVASSDYENLRTKLPEEMINAN